MNEILGIIIPMLMSGSDVMDIIKALGGTSGAAGMDGLEGMMRTQANNARRAYPLVQNQSTISNAAEMLLDRLGINPYTGLGQGISSFLGSMYHVAPDTIGTILGVPYGGQFFSTIANGSSGINEAAGRGSVDIFNPYSVMSAHENTRNLARRMYDFGVKANGGYDVSYGHGLNMGEMGKVAQRILSSRIPYMDEDGRRLDLSRDENGKYNNDQDVEKFNSNLKKLGSEFNDAASMLAKMTGSIDEALKVMDRMAGGNFLGGSAEQAKSVAERARHMAAAIRITSAIAGTSPQEAYANMQGLAQTMSAGIGMTPYIANQSGYTAMMGNMAYHATAAYGMWSAMNPTATQEQRAQALLAANGRATRYASENGAAFSAMIADNMDLFSEEELKRAEVAMRTGNPNVIQKMIRDKIGADRYSRYMTDPAFQIAARYRATMPGNEARAETLRKLDSAGMEGGLQQAETEGNKMLMRSVLADLDLDLSNVTGKGGSSLRKERDNFSLRRLRQMAQGYGLDSKKVSGMGEDELVEFLEKRPGMDSVRLGRILNTSKIEAAERQIDRMTMTGSEDSSARIRARSAIRSSNAWNSQGKNELIRRIDAGEDLDAVMTDFTSPMKAKDAREIRKDVMQGKLTAEQARVEKARFADLKDSQRIDASTRETMDSLREDVKRSEVQNAGLLKGFAASEGFGDLADKFALEKYSGDVGKLLDNGKVSIGDDDRSLTKTYETAARNIVSRVFKNDFGSMSAEDANKLVGTMAKDIVMGIRSGKTMGESFASSLGGLSDEQKKAIGSSRVEKIVEDAKNENSKMSRTDMNIGSLLNESTSVIEKETEKAGILNMDAGKANSLRSLSSAIGGMSGDKSDISRLESLKEYARRTTNVSEEVANASSGKAIEQIVDETKIDEALKELPEAERNNAKQQIVSRVKAGLADNKSLRQSYTEALQQVKAQNPQNAQLATRLDEVVQQAQDSGTEVGKSLDATNLLEKTSDNMAESGKSVEGLRTAARNIINTVGKSDKGALDELKRTMTTQFGIDQKDVEASSDKAIEQIVDETKIDEALKELPEAERNNAKQQIVSRVKAGLADNKSLRQSYTEALQQVKAQNPQNAQLATRLDEVVQQAQDSGTEVGKSLDATNLLEKTSDNMADETKKRFDNLRAETKDLGSKVGMSDASAINELRSAMVNNYGVKEDVAKKASEDAMSQIVSETVSDESLSGLTPEQKQAARTQIVNDMKSGLGNDKSLRESYQNAIQNVQKQFGGNLTDKGAGLGEIAKMAQDENSDIGKKLEVKNLLNSTTANAANSSGIENVKNAADTLGRKDIKDDRSALNQFRNQIKQFKEQGKVSFAVDDKSLSEMFSKGGQRMVLDVLGGEDKKLGDLEGEGLQKLAASVHSKMMDYVNNQGMSLDEGFALAIGNLSEDQKKAIGKGGRDQIQKFIDQSKKGGIEGISAKNYVSAVIGVADEKNKESRMAAVDRMDELLKGNFGKNGMAGATKEFIDLSKQVGLFKGDDKEAAKIRTDAVKSFVSDAMGAYGVGGKDQAEIVAKAEKTVDTKFGGDYSKAIQAATMDRAKATGNKKLASLAKAVGGRDDVNTSIMGGMLKAMKPEVKRKPSFAAIAQSGSADLAAVNMAAVSASLTGLDMGEVLMNQFAPDLLSATDASVADASMNRIPNALQIGASTFAKTAVDKTKTQMSNLGKALRDNGIRSEATLKLALSDENTDEAKKAREDLGKAVGGYNTAEGKKNLNLLKTINEGAKIGGKSAYEVMMGGEEAIKNISKTQGADKDVLNLTRESNRKGSDSYQILDKLGNITKDLASFFDNKNINVIVKGGTLDVSGSSVKVNTN